MLTVRILLCECWGGACELFRFLDDYTIDESLTDADIFQVIGKRTRHYCRGERLIERSDE